MDLISTMLTLCIPLVHCPITSVGGSAGGAADISSISDHISTLEQQVNTLQLQFESELKSTMVDLINVKNQLKASQEVQVELRSDIRDKCRILQLTSVELNSTKTEIVRLKDEVSEVRTTCLASARSLINISEIVGRY